jgi:hypothetical protein
VGSNPIARSIFQKSRDLASQCDGQLALASGKQGEAEASTKSRFLRQAGEEGLGNLFRAGVVTLLGRSSGAPPCSSLAIWALCMECSHESISPQAVVFKLRNAFERLEALGDRIRDCSERLVGWRLLLRSAIQARIFRTRSLIRFDPLAGRQMRSALRYGYRRIRSEFLCRSAGFL